MHVQDRDLTGGTCYPLHEGHNLFTGGAACTKNLNRSFGCHSLILSIVRLLVFPRIRVERTLHRNRELLPDVATHSTATPRQVRPVPRRGATERTATIFR